MDATKQIRIIFTTDIHGNYFPYDFRHERWGKGSLQRVHAFVAQQLKAKPVSTILVDGGDILQGEPTAYYLNFVAQDNQHKVAEMCNFIGYDVGVIGNHDLETGHEVFDRFVDACNYPILGANCISDETGLPYFEPYTILRRSGVKIAIIGFVTPAIPHWIPKQIWHDLHFEDIAESAKKWVAHVKEVEEPDYIIGLFHSGMEEGIITPDYKENAVRETASTVSGFDLILYGHDHASNMDEVENPEGRNILCVNPGCYAHSVAEVNINFNLNKEGVVTSHETSSQLYYIGTMSNTCATDFKRHFASDFRHIKDFASEKIGTFTESVNINDAYFGSSAYIDLIQSLQLKVSQADISLAAPLFFNASIEAGDVKVSNLFDLYRFEDHLYTILLTGKEIKNYLEMSYSAWTNQMKDENDTMLQLQPMKNNPSRMGFKNFIFNFDSAAGIIYTVDVSKPEGERICIERMANGKPFKEDEVYTVAMTAYRANGGGELLTKGAGLSKEEISSRIINCTEKDMRHYLMLYIKEQKIIQPKAMNHWKFIPEKWVAAATERERAILFG